MPYRFTHHAAAFVFVAILVAFWPSYFGQLGDAPLAFHSHAIIASGWVLLIVLQSWSIHNGRLGLHRTFGRASLVLFPLLIMTLVMIMDVSAATFAGGDPYYAVVGPVFGAATLVAMLAYLVLITLALRYRRHVHLHSGFMVTSLFFLWEPAASRLLARYIEPFSIGGPADFHKVVDLIAIGTAMVVPVGVYLYATNRKRGTPFLIATGFLIAQIAAVCWIADTETFRRAFAAYAQWVPAYTASAGLALGALAAWIGWRYPARQAKTSASATKGNDDCSSAVAS
ncbi:MAG: hypothetical protein KGY48_13140 [Wenzhouxiangellaceae bacterium]|nr:hypothetical protein [Wenzhouxiangellaceae bacterium]